jgi:integrase
MLALQARVGNRRGELLLAERGWYDRAKGTLTIPAEVAKERREKPIPLLPDEVELLDEQTGALRIAAGSVTAHLPATAAGSQLLWPMPDGRPWPLQDGAPASSYYERHVWAPAIAEAKRRYREEEALPADAATPFDTLTSHDLRVTAVTQMMLEGMSEATCAYRVGHRDAQLIRRVYDQRDRAVCAAAELAGIAAARAAAVVIAPAEVEVEL